MIRCASLTRDGSKCKRYTTDTYCKIHQEQQCSICLDTVKFAKSKHLSCNHYFHNDCIVNWFKESDSCPICRTEQNEDSLIIFKHAIEDKMRLVYRDAIRTLEERLNRRRNM